MIRIQLELPQDNCGVYNMWFKCPECGVVERTFFNTRFPDAWYKDRCHICKAIWPNAKAMHNFDYVRLGYHRNTAILPVQKPVFTQIQKFFPDADFNRGAL